MDKYVSYLLLKRAIDQRMNATTNTNTNTATNTTTNTITNTTTNTTTNTAVRKETETTNKSDGFSMEDYIYKMLIQF